jgi:hypothetical protein
LINAGALIKLDPFALTRKKRAIEASKRGAEKRQAKVHKNREFVKQLLAPSVAPIRGEDEYAPF